MINRTIYCITACIKTYNNIYHIVDQFAYTKRSSAEKRVEECRKALRDVEILDISIQELILCDKFTRLYDVDVEDDE